MPRSIPFALKLFPPDFGGICEDWVHLIFQNHDFRFSPNTPPSDKIKPKHQNHGTWHCTNHAKINSFGSQNFPTSLWRHWWGLSPTTFPKPWFRCSPNTPPNEEMKPKHQNHETWLCTEHPKIISFRSQTSPIWLWRHLWEFSPARIAKPWLSYFTQHTTKSQNQAKTPKSWNLAMHQPCQDKFLLLPKFSYITLEAFVRIESSQFCKTMIFRFSPNTPPSHKIKQKHQNHGTWLCTNHIKINSFLSQISPITLEAFVRI